MKRYIIKWELLGAVFIIIIGSALHFAFEWSRYWRPVAVFAAVNESVWEHLKLVFWPSLFWAILETKKFQMNAYEYWAAKGYGFLVAPVLIIAIFYTYTAVIGHNILILDIGTFIIAIVLGQLATARLLNAKSIVFLGRGIGLGLLLCQLAAYSIFTFYPPEFFLFEDSRSGTSGIPIHSTRH